MSMMLLVLVSEIQLHFQNEMLTNMDTAERFQAIDMNRDRSNQRHSHATIDLSSR
jgi:hypothetical protein